MKSFIVILGEQSSGKTSLLRLLAKNRNSLLLREHQLKNGFNLQLHGLLTDIEVFIIDECSDLSFIFNLIESSHLRLKIENGNWVEIPRPEIIIASSVFHPFEFPQHLDYLQIFSLSKINQ